MKAAFLFFSCLSVVFLRAKRLMCSSSTFFSFFLALANKTQARIYESERLTRDKSETDCASLSRNLTIQEEAVL